MKVVLNIAHDADNIHFYTEL